MRENDATRYLFLYGGAIGDTLLGIHIGRTLSQNKPGARLVLASTRKSTIARELAADISFVDYIELPKDNFRSWLALAGMMVNPWKSVIYDPFVSPVSWWWKIILWSVSRFPGSLVVRCQIRPRRVPSYARTLPYDSRTMNLFNTPAAVLHEWGIDVTEVPLPHLPVPHCASKAAQKYIVFHFFAGAYRRSIPVAHARDILLEARKHFPQHIFIVTCASAEQVHALEVARDIADTTVRADVSAKELMCLLAQSDLCVGVASGVTHIAAHLLVPSVVMCNLSDPCWLPSYNPDVIQLAAREECGCNGDKTGDCAVETPHGLVYRCLYFITTQSVIGAMQQKIAKK